MSSAAVIVSWNCRGPLARCLASLRAARCPAVVVDNASSDGTPEAVRREFPEATMLAQADNAGFSAGVNTGVRHVLEAFPDAESILLLNPDTELPAETLAAMERALADDPSLGVVGPALVGPDGAPQPYAFGCDPTPGYLLRRGARRLLRNRALHEWAGAGETSPDWLTGACLLARAEVFRRDGLFFDEGYFLYFEDNDWCLRLRERGWKLRRLPEVRCVHLGGASVSANPAAAAAYRRSLRRFYRLHYPAWARLLLELMLPLYAGLARARGPGCR